MVSSLSQLSIPVQPQPDFADQLRVGNAARISGLQADALQRENQDAEHATHIRNLQILNALGSKLLQVNQDKRSEILNSYAGVLDSIGIAPKDISQAPLDDAGLKSFVDNTSAILQQLQQPQNKGYQFDKQLVLKDENNNLFYASQVGAAGSGDISSRVIPVSGDPNTKPVGKLSIVGSQGVTPEESVGIAGSKAEAEMTGRQKVKALTEPSIAKDIKTKEQEAIYQTQPNIEQAVTSKKEQAQADVKRRSEWKSQGVIAAENMAALRRSLDLLKEVETGGGVDTWRKIQNYLGVTTADQGELDSLFKQSMLGQLRGTFGGNPTEGERSILGESMSSFKNPNDVNARNVSNAIKLGQLRIDRGIRAARAEKDSATEDEINSALSLSYKPEQKTAKSIPNTNSKGWILHVDAKGNKAYVGPNNEVEEVK